MLVEVVKYHLRAKAIIKIKEKFLKFGGNDYLNIKYL